jgi:hypothetical protein
MSHFKWVIGSGSYSCTVQWLRYNRLGPKFFGPYQILEHVGDVSSKLKLPPGAKLHDVFHVGLSKKFCGDPLASMVALPPICHSQACLEPSTVVKSCLARDRHELLIHRKGLSPSDASWINLEEFQSLYPTFQLEDELVVEGGRDVIWGKKYAYCCAKQKQGSTQVGAGMATPPSTVG